MKSRWWLLSPAPLLVVALIAARRCAREDPAPPAQRPLSPSLQALGPERLAALAPVMRKHEAARARVNRKVQAIAVLRRHQLVAHAAGCSPTAEAGDLPLVPRDSLPPIRPAGCEPPRPGALRPAAVPARTQWPELHVAAPARPSRSRRHVPLKDGTRTAHVGDELARELELLEEQLEEIRRIVPPRHEPSLLRARMECLADASGVRLLELELGPDVPHRQPGTRVELRRVDVRLRAEGPQEALAEWMVACARHDATTRRATLRLSPHDPALVEAHLELRAFILP